MVEKCLFPSISPSRPKDGNYTDEDRRPVLGTWSLYCFVCHPEHSEGSVTVFYHIAPFNGELKGDFTYSVVPLS